MDFLFGTNVRRDNGDRLGEVHRVVYDPQTTEIVSIVVHGAGLAGDDVLIPIGLVDSADIDDVVVNVSDTQFDHFETFVTERNIAPPPDAANVTSDLIQQPADVPDVPPVGAATGVESIAFTPVLEESQHVPTGDVVIDGATTVWATDGEVGRVTEVRVDDQTNRVVSLITERGAMFKHANEIAAEYIKSVLPENITLSVSRAELTSDDDR